MNHIIANEESVLCLIFICPFTLCNFNLILVLVIHLKIYCKMLTLNKIVVYNSLMTTDTQRDKVRVYIEVSLSFLYNQEFLEFKIDLSSVSFVIFYMYFMKRYRFYCRIFFRIIRWSFGQSFHCYSTPATCSFRKLFPRTQLKVLSKSVSEYSLPLS